jgi:hypothetical protein
MERRRKEEGKKERRRKEEGRSEETSFLFLLLSLKLVCIKI